MLRRLLTALFLIALPMALSIILMVIALGAAPHDGPTPFLLTQSPLALVSLLYLMAGSAWIGLVEVSVLRRRYRLSGRPWLQMALACYLSSWTGYLAMGRLALDRRLGDQPLSAAPAALAGFTLAAFTAKAVLEWPFCWRIAEPGPRRAATAWRMPLLAQTVSLAILLPGALLLSRFSVYTTGRVQRNLDFVKPPIATVYYIGDDGAVWSIRTDGTHQRKVVSTEIRGEGVRLALVAAKRGAEVWVTSEHYEGEPQPLVPALSVAGRFVPDESVDGTEGNYGLGLDFRRPDQRGWIAESRRKADGGLEVRRGGASVYSLALETPFVQWRCRNLSTLPNDQTVFQLGPQIVILDLPTRRIGFLAKGRGPAVTIP